MNLGELIRALEAVEDQDAVLKFGFNNPHSYRGDYYDLAFEPAQNVTVASMLACAKAAVGETYRGYKGGDFTMSEWTSVHLSEWGDTGESIGPFLLRYMLAGKMVNEEMEK